MKRLYTKLPALLLTLIVGLLATSTAFGAATIVIENADAAGVGFNDPTPVAPVGGNGGTTLGQQRLNAFQFAANVWGATLTSVPTITIRASWAPLTCTADSGAIGQAGNSGSIWRNFSGSVPETWYGNALANALTGIDRNGATTAEINAQFNVNLGNPGCLERAHWYYGLDSNAGAGGIDLVTVLLHEFGHGLGFQTFTNTATGLQAGNDAAGRFPSIFDRFLFDNSTNKSWPQMTDTERVASAINTSHLVWNGPQVVSDVPNVLGTPRLRVNSPPAIAGNYLVGTAEFGARLTSSGVTAGLVQALDQANSAGPTTTDACSPLTNADAVSGKIALIDRGTCLFVEKVKNAQNAGAIGVIIADHTAGSPPPGLGGSDPTITIPAVRITLADGNTIKAQPASGVNATLLVDGSAPGGADSSARPQMYAPSPREAGSSVSHWDTSAFPNQLMEPNISSDLSHSVAPPLDLTFSLLRDIGWLSTNTNQTNQTITFPALADKTFGDPPFTMNATASSGLPVSFSIVSGPANISGNTITITGAGPVTVRASQPGDVNFNAATSVDRPFTVNKANQTVTFNALANKTFGDAPFNVSASTSSGLVISFNIVSGPATISGNTISITGLGVVTVRASQPGDDNFNAALFVDRSFTVDGGTFQQVVLNLDQVEIKTWTIGGRTFAYLKLSFPNAGYQVTNWGQAVRAGNDFPADAAVERFTGASVQAVTTTAQIYDLGPLADGNYTFTFKNSGTTVKSQAFSVSSAATPPNPIDDAGEFVTWQYRDFLNREPDAAGHAFWTDNITKCNDPARRPPGQTVETCTLRQRETTSGAFFVSPEFQYTGYYVYRMYQGALGRQPKLSEFTPDAQFVGAGIIVNGQLSGAKIEENKAAFAAQFVNCTDPAKYRCGEFKAIYDGLSNQAYVDKLFQTTGVPVSASDKDALVNELNANPATGRASILQKVVDGITVISEGNQRFDTTYGQAFYNSELNRAFVQLEYFGYMKRDPDADGYAHWLGKLNQFGGDFVAAEMVLAFITSPEYRSRFGQP